jgi:hypothetical protein
MRTSYSNRSRENIVGTLVATAVLAFPPLSCGLALAMQPRGMNTRRAAILEMCNTDADAAARSGELPGVGAGSIELPDLRAEYRTSPRARDAFAACMDKRAFDGFPRPFNAGTGESPPASARRTH